MIWSSVTHKRLNNEVALQTRKAQAFELLILEPANCNYWQGFQIHIEDFDVFWQTKVFVDGLSALLGRSPSAYVCILIWVSQIMKGFHKMLCVYTENILDIWSVPAYNNHNFITTYRQ